VALTGVEFFSLAHSVTVSFFQFAENDGGQDGHAAQNKKGVVDAVNELLGIGTKAIGQKEGGYERRRCHAETDRHLLHGAGDGTGAARLLLGDFGVDQSVHAGVLQRSEESVGEHFRHDQPHRRALADGCEEQDQQADDQGVRDEHGTVSEGCKNARHRQLEAHGGDGLGHHEKAGLDGRESEAHLIQKRKQKWDTANAEAREKAAADRRAKGSKPK